MISTLISIGKFVGKGLIAAIIGKLLVSRLLIALPFVSAFKPLMYISAITSFNAENLDVALKKLKVYFLYNHVHYERIRHICLFL